MILLEPLSSSQSDSQLLSLLESPALVKTDSQGVAHVVLSNLRKTPQKCQQGDELAIAVSADVIEPAADHAVPLPRSPAVREISTSDRMTKLFSLRVLAVQYVLYCYVPEITTSLLLGEWSSPRFTGQPPLPCDNFTLTPVGERRAALFGGYNGSSVYNDDLLIVELTKHTVVSA